MIVFVILLILDSDHLPRFVAILIAFVSYFALKATGLSLPPFVLLDVGASPNQYFISSIYMIIAGIAGMIFARYFLKLTRKPDEANEFDEYDEIRSRFATLIFTLITLLFADIYLAALQNSDFYQQNLNVALIPNLAFLFGIGVYILFYLPQNHKI